ncbi:MAG: hypothetical protein AAGD12_00255 [Pseudomonadota bacterium]
MARRRLSPAMQPAMRPATHPAAGTDPSATPPAFTPPVTPHVTPPIAQVTGESAAQAALEEVTRSLEAAREDGRLVLDIPLGEIAADHLTRDRVALEDEEMAALIESLRLHGQRMPVEVIRLPAPAADGPDLGPDLGAASGPRWGLISGWRRLAALRRLLAETGESRFATIRALIRQDTGAAAAYVSMVEENEIRVGLSYYERARLAAITAAQGVFEDERAAIRALFAAASRAKRSKIASFLLIHHHLGDMLRFPTHIPERLGLRLAEALRTDYGPEMLRRGLPLELRDTPAQELAALDQAITAPVEDVSRAKRPRRAAPAQDSGAADVTGVTGMAEMVAIAPDIRMRLTGGAGGLTLRLEGAGVDEALRTRLAAALPALLSRSE